MGPMADDSLNTPTRSYTYPLERYLIARPKQESKIDFSKFVDHSTTEEDLENLAKISSILKMAEEEMDHIVSKMSPKEPQTVYLKDPDYFDKDFDRKRYVRDLVKAKINKMNIVQQGGTGVRKGMVIPEQSDTGIRRENANEIRQTDRLSFENESPKINKPECCHGDVNNLNMKLTNSVGVNNNLNKTKTGHNIGNSRIKGRLQKVFINMIDIPAQETEQIQTNEGIVETRNSLVKNSHVFEMKSQENEQRECISNSKPPSSKLTFRTMETLHIRTQLKEQKIPPLDIFPGDENNSHREKLNNVGFVEIKYCEEKVQTPKKVQINEDTNAVEQSSFVGSSDSHFEISTDRLLTMNQDKRDDFLEKILQPHRVISSSRKNSNRGTRHAETMSQKYESPYMFLGGSNVDHLSNDFDPRPNRGISKLKKYAIPEIQRIYSSRPIESFNSVYANKRGSTSVKSCSIPLMHSKSIPRSRHVYMHSDKTYDNNLPSTSGYSRQKSNVEYIPYTQLTVGGFSTTDLNLKAKSKKHVSKSSGTEAKSTKKDLAENDEVESKHANPENVDDDNGGGPENEKDTVDDSKSNSTDNKSVINYADDFDDEDSKSQFSTDKSKSVEENYSEEFEDQRSPTVLKNVISSEITERKISSKLNMKTKIDVFDFIHCIEKKDDFTQSNLTSELSFKETQTSPREEDVNDGDVEKGGDNKTNPSIVEPKMDIANITLKEMIELQERLSYINSQIISNQLDKISRAPNALSPKKDTTEVKLSPRKASEADNMPKNTQTSPMKTSHMMTSPAKMISRILSPVFHDTYTDAQTSPMDPLFGVIDEISEITQRDHIVSPQIDVPPSPQAILSNINSASRIRKETDRVHVDFADVKASTSKSKIRERPNVKFKTRQVNKDSTDACTDVSQSESSDTHSIGEINLRIFKKKSILIKSQSTSHSTSTSFTTNSSSDVHFDSVSKKSDGELSVGQVLGKT